MWAAVLGWLSPKKLMYAGIAILIALAVWQGGKFVNNAIEDARLVEQQRIEIQLKDGEIKTQNILLEVVKRAHAISDEELAQLEKRLEGLDDISDIAIGAEDDKDGTIAPVLQDTLRALRERYP